MGEEVIKNKAIVFLSILLIIFSLVPALASNTKSFDSSANKISISDDKGSEKASYELVENSNYCSNYCYALINYSSKSKTSEAYGGIKFKNKKGEEKEINSYKITDLGDQILIEGWKAQRESIDWVINLFGLDLDEWAWWTGVQSVYDEIDDSSIDSSLWTYSLGTPNGQSETTIEETTDYLNLKSYAVYSYGDHAGTLQTILMPSIEDIENVTTTVWVMGDGTDAGGGSGSFYFGNQLIISKSYSGVQQSDGSVWTFERNQSCGTNCFDVYDDAVYSTSINASNSILKCSTTAGQGGTGDYGEGNCRFYYVYYWAGQGIELTSPADSSSQSTKEVTHNCTVKTDGATTIANVSLWGNFTGSWALNDTIDLTATNPTEYNATFTINVSDVDSYFWNCIAFDNEGNEATAEANFSYSVPDVTAPNVTLISPPGDVNNKTFLINLSINDNVAVDYCFYNLTAGASTEIENTELVDDDSDGYYNTTLTVSAYADYILNVACNDSASNIATESYEISVSEETSQTVLLSTAGSSGSSTDNGVCNVDIYKPTSGIYFNQGNVISEPVLFVIQNIGTTQDTINFELSDEIKDFCSLNRTKIVLNGRSLVDNYITCNTTQETITGKIIIRGSSCDTSLPVYISPTWWGSLLGSLGYWITAPFFEDSVYLFGMSLPAETLYLFLIPIGLLIVGLIYLFKKLGEWR